MTKTSSSATSVAVDCSVFSYAHGGLASFFRSFLRKLPEQYPDISFTLVMPESVDGAFIPTLPNVSVRTYDESKPLFAGHGRSLRAPLALSLALHRVQANYLLSPYYAFFIPPRYKNKSIICLHDTCFWDVPQYFSAWDRLKHKTFIAWNSRMAKEILTVSNTSKERILRNFPNFSAEKMTVVYNAWKDWPRDSTPRPGRVLQGMLARAPKHLFLSSGGFSPTKNVITVLKALKAALEHRKDLGLVITGSARYVGHLWQIIDDLALQEHVFPVGGISTHEMEWLLKERTTAAVCMSLYEGFGRSVVEAMRVGLPLICSTIPTNREIAGDYPSAYCDVDDTDAVCRAMLRVAESERHPPVLDDRFSFARNWQIFEQKFIALTNGTGNGQ